MNLDYFYGEIPVPIRARLKRFMMAVLKHKLVSFYSQFIKPGSLVFDIGACEGDYSEAFLKLQGKVIALEPQPDYIYKLLKKFKGRKNIEIIHAGVGAKTGTLDLHISTFNGPNSTFSSEFRNKSRYNYRSWDKIVKVKMTTLESLIQKHGVPDFCKIDVEGYEFEVLKTLKKPIPQISFEFLSELDDKTDKIISFLSSLGQAKYNLCLGMNYKYVLPSWTNGDELKSFLKKNKSRNLNGDIYVRFG